MEQESDKKRKRDEVSSVSEADTSLNTSIHISKKQAEDKEIRDKYNVTTPKEKKKDRKKKRKGEKDEEIDETLDTNLDKIEKRISANDKIMQSIHAELKQINSKMESMTTKTEIESVFKRMFESSMESIVSRIKEDVYKSVSHRIDIVEGEIHTLNNEKDKLVNEAKVTKGQIEDKNREIKELHDKIDKARHQYMQKTNDLEQYTRKNSIRISGPGIPIEENKENAAETTTTAVKILNTKMGMNITDKDIDIAHRIGLMRREKPRGIIVKFTSRLSKIASLKDKRTKLKGTGIFVQEDLTQLNARLLNAVRNNTETEAGWSFEGQIYVKHKANGNVEKISFEDYEHWLR